MNFEDYLSYCTMSKAVTGVLVYASVLIQISLASSAGPCGGIRGRFICDDNDPQVFHICMGNQKYTNRCPGDLHYNVRTQTCDWPKAVNCVEEARQHAKRTSSGEIKVADLGGTPEDNNAVDSDEDFVSTKNEDKRNNLDIPTNKLKPSFDQNPKVQNKQPIYPDAMDDYSVRQDNVFAKSEEVGLPVKVTKDESGSIQMAEINTKNRSEESKDTLDGVPKLKEPVQRGQLNESTFEITTPRMLVESNPSRPIQEELAGHMIETYKANDTPEVFLYTRPVPRQRNKRPSMSPYKKSQISNTSRQSVTTRRPVTTTPNSRQLTTSTPPTQRQPVTTSRSPFRKTTVVYHPFLTNRTKPDYREYAPQLTTRRPPDSKQPKDRSKWSPHISAAPYRSATNYADDISGTPKWYELGEDKKTSPKPESNSYGNRLGKVSKNNIEHDSGEVNKDSDYAEDNSEKPLTSTKSPSLPWFKSSTNSYTTTGKTFPAPDALEKVRNAIRSRNMRDRRLKTTTVSQESLTTPFAEEVNKHIKRFKPKTPLAQAWINERKGHNFEDDYENQDSGSPFKKNRWYSTERLSTTATSDRNEEKGTSPQIKETTDVTKEPTSTTKSKTPSWTYSKTSMYSTDARNIAKQFKGTAAINAAAARDDRDERRQKVTEINSVQEVTPKASSKLPWWSMGTNRDTSVAPVHEHEVGEHQPNPFYRRAFLPRHSGARKPNYHTRTPLFDADYASSDQDQEKGSLLYRPKDQPAKAKERSFDLLKVDSDSDSERRFSLHRNYGPAIINTAESEDRTFALHKAKNRATNQYSAAAAADRRPQANGAINAPASSDQISIDATRTEELAKNIDDKIENKNPIEKYEYKKGKCSSDWCKLPDCRCVGSDIPGELDAKDIPQMVMLTFDDSINSQNMGYYKTIFNGTLKNPNGCPIKSTFYVSGDNSDYEMVRKMYKGGHEIASHTLSHRSPTTWWADAGYDNWEQEIIGMKKRLNEKSGVPLKEITGMRAPFLQVGGDAQYAMLKENKFRYDTSMVTGNLYANNEPPAWPFTLDTPPDSRTCSLTPCPTRSYPGLWEVPLIRWYGSNKMACAMPDACTIGAGTKGSRKFIEDNFMRHYTTNRAPFGIFIHASWFGRKDGNIEGLVEFLASLADKSDVWVVTVSQALDWIQKPVRLSAISAIDSWMC